MFPASLALAPYGLDWRVTVKSTKVECEGRTGFGKEETVVMSLVAFQPDESFTNNRPCSRKPDSRRNSSLSSSKLRRSPYR